MPKPSCLKKQENPHVKKIKVALFSTFFVTTFAFGLYSIFLAMSEDYETESTFNNPTSIPWINDQAACARSGRTWVHGKCWDYEHSSMF